MSAYSDYLVIMHVLIQVIMKFIMQVIFTRHYAGFYACHYAGIYFGQSNQAGIWLGIEWGDGGGHRKFRNVQNFKQCHIL